jgi:hypothetical protein
MSDPSFLATEISKRAVRALSSIDRTALHNGLAPLEVVDAYEERPDGWKTLAHQAGVTCLGPHAQEAVRRVLLVESELRGYEILLNAGANLDEFTSGDATLPASPEVPVSTEQGRTAVAPVPSAPRPLRDPQPQSVRWFRVVVIAGCVVWVAALVDVIVQLRNR